MKNANLFDISLACKTAILAVKEYCRESSVPRREAAAVLDGLKHRDLSSLNGSDWFLLYDSLGTRGNLDASTRELYTLANYTWYMSHHFSGLTSDAPERAEPCRVSRSKCGRF